MQEFFRKMSTWVAAVAGSHWTFLVAVGLIVGWFFARPLFPNTEDWLLALNTVATGITFLMVFILQNAQNRNAKVAQLKLDELIRGVEGSRTHMVNLQSLTDEELDELEAEFAKLQRRARARAAEGEMRG